MPTQEKLCVCGWGEIEEGITNCYKNAAPLEMTPGWVSGSILPVLHKSAEIFRIRVYI